jgi:site-specific DNA recombinase
MENAGLLARVSGRGQEDNSSPESQLQRARDYCKAKGYAIAAERIEVMSGAFVLARSTFNELLEMAADGRISVIVADIPDRLGRGDAISKLELLAELNGARVEFAQPGRDVDTVEGLVQHSAEQMVSGIERLNIRRRTMGGKRAWAEKGRIIASRQAPLGYEYVRERDSRGRKTACTLAIVPDMAAIALRIYRMCAIECMTTRSIARQLNDDKVPSPYGKQWTFRTIDCILRSTTYKGVWRYGKVDQKRHDGVGHVSYTAHQRDASETVAVSCPAIVDEALWDGAQEQLRRNHAKFVKPTVHTYLLRGRIKCAACGRIMCGEFLRSQRGAEVDSHGYKGTCYYYCTRHNIGDVRCNARRLRARDVERIVWELVSGEIQDVDRLVRKVKEEREKGDGKRRHVQQVLTATQALIDKARSRYDRFERLYGDGALNREKLDAYRAERDSEVAKRETEKQELEQQLVQNAELPPDFERDLRELRAALTDRLTPDTPVDARLRFYDMLRIECDYNSDDRELTVKGLMGKRTVGLTSTCSTRLAQQRGGNIGL